TMKTIKHIAVFITVGIPLCVFSQGTPPSGTSTNGGTITVNNSETGVNIYQRDEVHVPVGSTDIHITPNSNTDAHLYLDPTIILPTTYATGGNNTNQGSGTTVNPPSTSLPVGATGGTWSVEANGSAAYTIPII